MKRTVLSMLLGLGLAVSAAQAPDNSKVNQRDRKEQTKTPADQGQNEQDVERTRTIRQQVVAIDGLSTDAKNVKIITQNGKVTLRGPVKSASEKERVEAAAKQVAGAGNVTSELEVKNQ